MFSVPRRGALRAVRALGTKLWDSSIPVDARGTVQKYVMRLRRILNSQAILTEPDGYRIKLTAGQLDLDQFGELMALIQEHPLRERFWVQLMGALAGTGRQGEALEAYREVVRLLADELGVAPGPNCAPCTRRSCAAPIGPGCRPRPGNPCGSCRWPRPGSSGGTPSFRRSSRSSTRVSRSS